MHAIVLATLTWMVLPPAAESAHFQRDIRPLLSNRCFTCHGPDEASREAELRLDRFEEATRDRDGYQVIRPGDPQASELVRRVSSTDDDERMPPADHGSPLTEHEIALLTDWIRSGAAYDQHWAFRPVQRPPLPEVSGDWPRNAIDMFVLAAQRRAGLEPSTAADRRTLIRRVYLDVLGLLPTPEQVQAFVDDPHGDAYQRLVERVLASPHYGERWGRHWLDQARYADTNGYTIDSERSIWLYRDWVVRALNDDMPFDQFTIEQLAGDLLPSPGTSQLIATGFHRNTLVNQEGGTDREQFRVEVAMDRVDTTGTVWLGLTVGCARCHHHKFDPISQREYYQLYAFFNSAQDANSVDPTISVPSDAEAVQLKELNEQLAVAQRALRDYDQAHQQQLPESERNDGKPIQWAVVRPAATSTANDTALMPLDDGSLLATGANAAQEEYKILWVAEPGKMTAIRLETLTHPSLPKGGPGRAENGNFVLNEIELQSETDQQPAWIHATADHSQKDYPVTAAIDGDAETGWAINGGSGGLNQNRTAVFVLAQPLQIKEDTPIELRLVFGPTPPHYNLGRFRVSVSDSATTKFNLPDAQRSQLAAEVEQRRQAVNQFSKRIPTTMVMRELPQPRKSHLLIRGDFLRPGEEVRPDVPAVLPALTTEAAADHEAQSASDYGRLDLARWLVRSDHPLTGRVLVNRIWMHYFGQGLVETENDFGIQSSLPTHPELLDWLAAELVDQGWSLKHLHRLILESATYRQSSRQRSDVAQIDPRNLWLARQNRLRVDAEIVRDLALCASGLLEDRVGGPSVYPPQPAGVYAFTQRQANWPTSQGADRYRRGLYTFFMRSAPFPMMTTFDAPRFNTTCTRRGRSNTPLQSLMMANDQALVEMSQAFARRALEAQVETDQNRLSWMFEVCMARNPEGDELELLNRYLDQTRRELADDPAAARQLAGLAADDPRDAVALGSWTAVARLLMNLDEFLNRE